MGKTIEINLEAKESTVYISKKYNSVSAYTYNGNIPGPTIRAKVGDTIIVNFINNLNEPSTVHWHGIDSPAINDGSTISQVHIVPGDSYQYKFKVDRAGTFWYHAHVLTFHQLHKGLYGAIVVEDPKEECLNIPKKSTVLILGDAKFKNKHEFDTTFSTNPIEGGETRFNGRIGKVLLVNGIHKPEIKLCGKNPQRLRLINVANSRFMRVDIPCHKMWRIGGDGGLLESPIKVIPIMGDKDKDPSHGILLTPGERADIVFIPKYTNKSDTAFLKWYDLPRGLHKLSFGKDETCHPVLKVGDDEEDGNAPSKVMAVFKYCCKSHENSEYNPPEYLRVIKKIEVNNSTPVLPILYGHMPPTVDGNVVFFGSPKPFLPGMLGPKPFEELLKLPEQMPKFKPNDTIILKIINASGADHNYHIHGFPFQLIKTSDEINGKEINVVYAPYLEDKDTIFIKKRPGPFGTKTFTYLALKFSLLGRTPSELVASGGFPTIKCKGEGENRSGGWMFHCHIDEHIFLGMGGYIQIEL